MMLQRSSCRVGVAALAAMAATIFAAVAAGRLVLSHASSASIRHVRRHTSHFAAPGDQRSGLAQGRYIITPELLGKRGAVHAVIGGVGSTPPHDAPSRPPPPPPFPPSASDDPDAALRTLIDPSRAPDSPPGNIEAENASWAPAAAWPADEHCDTARADAYHLVPGPGCEPHCTACQMVCLPESLLDAFKLHGGQLGSTCAAKGCATLVENGTHAGLRYATFTCERAAMDAVLLRTRRQVAHAARAAAQAQAPASAGTAVAAGDASSRLPRAHPPPSPRLVLPPPAGRERVRLAARARVLIYVLWVLVFLLALGAFCLAVRSGRAAVSPSVPASRVAAGGAHAGGARSGPAPARRIGTKRAVPVSPSVDSPRSAADALLPATRRPLTSARMHELEKELRRARRQQQGGEDGGSGGEARVRALEAELKRERRALLGLPVDEDAPALVLPSEQGSGALLPSTEAQRTRPESPARALRAPKEEPTAETEAARAARATRLCALLAAAWCALLVLLVLLLELGAISALAPAPPEPELSTGLTLPSAQLGAWLTRPAAGHAAVPGVSERVEQSYAPLRPNILVYLASDLGYADPRAFSEQACGAAGRSPHATPHLDQLSREGLSLTQYLTEPVCTPARAALLTGRQPARAGLGADVLPQRSLFSPGAPAGLRAAEITLASAVRSAGYATGFSGVWHLGVSAGEGAEGNGTMAFMPPAHGFDSSLALPAANSAACSPYAPAGAHPPPGFARSAERCFLVANSTIVQQPAYMFGLQRNLVEHARACMSGATRRGVPWLHLFADAHPSVALFTNPEFGAGPDGSAHGSGSADVPYGQVLRELDWAVGELIAHVDGLGQTSQTLLLFASANGPAREAGWDASGRTCGLKGGKGQTWEGGVRTPAIVRWPGTVPAGARSDAPVRSLDLMPTVLALVGVRLPAGVALDGLDQSVFLRTARDEHNPWLAPGARAQLHFCGTRPIAARVGQLKVHWATQNWAQPGEADMQRSGTYDPAVCVECCSAAGWTGGLHGDVTMCQCDDGALTWHDPPLVFAMDSDRNETSPIREGEQYDDALARASAARDELTRQLDRDGGPPPCVACALPVPLSAWPCCGGHASARAPQCTSRPSAQDMHTLRHYSDPAATRETLERLVRECTSAADREYALAVLLASAARASAAGGPRPRVGARGAAARLNTSYPCTCDLCTAPDKYDGGDAADGDSDEYLCRPFGWH